MLSQALPLPEDPGELRSFGSGDGEAARCYALAQTDIESAAMWGVKGLTSGS